ncbi:extracellular matrix/biofilm biosynthesis regulator RemA family protein [Zongyangia sp. HA2173]|uniref:extracellular matrix regulator RemB n=1 Tax=Zongyangia sp. HA2173 TaxID=3133035 RepID=UPI00174AFF2E
MYLHLGQDTVVKLSEVVAIFDLENASIAKATKRYLALAQKQGLVVNVSTELPKSFVVCVDEKGKNTVYISQISSATLKKRTNFVKEISI